MAKKQGLFFLLLIMILIVVLTGCSKKSDSTKYKLTVKTQGQGQVLPAAGNYEFVEGVVVDLTASPAEGWEFIKWLGAVAETDKAKTTILMNKDKTVQAVFEEELAAGMCKVVFDKNGGSIEAVPSTMVVAAGNSLEALPEEADKGGYFFLEWNTARDGSGEIFTADTIVNEDIIVYAQWGKGVVEGFNFTIAPVYGNTIGSDNPMVFKVDYNIIITGNTSISYEKAVLNCKLDPKASTISLHNGDRSQIISVPLSELSIDDDNIAGITVLEMLPQAILDGIGEEGLFANFNPAIHHNISIKLAFTDEESEPIEFTAKIPAEVVECFYAQIVDFVFRYSMQNDERSLSLLPGENIVDSIQQQFNSFISDFYNISTQDIGATIYLEETANNDIVDLNGLVSDNPQYIGEEVNLHFVMDIGSLENYPLNPVTLSVYGIDAGLSSVELNELGPFVSGQEFGIRIDIKDIYNQKISDGSYTINISSAGAGTIIDNTECNLIDGMFVLEGVSLEDIGRYSLIVSVNGVIINTGIIVDIVGDAVLSPSAISYIKGSAIDLDLTLNSNGRTFNNLSLAGMDLLEGRDYVVAGNNYTILSAYLDEKSPDDLILRFEMDGGEDPICLITVIEELKTAVVNVSTPKAGGTPDTQEEVEIATASSDYIVSSVSWDEGLTAEGKFDTGTKYSAKIELTAKDYKQFSSSPFIANVAGAELVGETTTIGAGPGNKVEFELIFAETFNNIILNQQPTETEAGNVISPAPVVLLTDQVGNPVSGVDVTVSEINGYSFAAGSLTQTTDASGTAVYDDLVIERAGSNYQLNFIADDPGIPEVSSVPFNVIATKEMYISATDISDTQTAGISFNIQNQITNLQDQYRNTAAEGMYQLLVKSNIDGEVFNESILFVNGQPAQSIDITLTTATEHTLTIEAGAAVDTATVHVGPSIASVQTIYRYPGLAKAGEIIPNSPSVKVVDEYDNPVAGIEIQVSEASGYIFDAGTLTRRTDSSGIAVFDDLVIHKAASGYQLIFKGDNIAELRSNSFTVRPLPISPEDSSITVINSPQVQGNPIRVQIMLADCYQNKIDFCYTSDFTFNYSSGASNIIRSNFDRSDSANGIYSFDITSSKGIRTTLSVRARETDIIETAELHWISNEAEIVSFSFDEQAGPITIDPSRGEIEVDVFKDSNLSSLIPTIRVSNEAIINPESGMPEDFSAPVTYTVQAENGDTKQWTVRVNKINNMLIQSEIQALIYAGWIPVATAEELKSIRSGGRNTYGAGTIWQGSYTSTYNDKYIQVNNIDLSAIASWPGIGVSWDPFCGKYNGNGLSISNMYENGFYDYVALFSETYSTAELSNIVLKNINIRADQYSAGLVACNMGKIKNCSVTGLLVGSDYNGGLVGVNYGTIEKSCSSVNVTSKQSHAAGGLAAINRGTIRDCYAKGDVSKTGIGYGGGLVGENSGTIVNTYATGVVTGASQVAALVGYNYEGTIASSYALEGSNSTFSKWGTIDQDSGFRSASELKRRSTFTGWNFSNIWEIEEGISNPYFQWQGIE